MEFRKEFKHFIQISIILLGIGSFYLASRTSLLYSNMTYVGNLIEYRILFIVWGIAQSSFFAFMAYFISKKYLQNKSLYITQGMILIDTIGNILSYLFPYTPPGGNLYSQLHVFLSVHSSMLAALILMYIIYKIMYINYMVFTKVRNQASVLLTLIVFLAMLLGDYTGIMEIVFLNGISYIMYTMLFE